MSNFPTEFSNILSTVRRPGDFFVSDSIEFPAPRLEIDGFGQIALPILPPQAKQLVAIAEQAPYGRGAETLVDTEVRRTWQIAAERVHISGKHWPKTLKMIIDRVATGFAINEPITAELYKLLLYDEGSFFVSHRDTEKVPGMFASLVLALPSMSTGGELIVRHKDREVRLDLRGDDPSEAAFAAFYADCIHEVLPVTVGCRAALVFNLVRHGQDSESISKPPSYEGEETHIAALLRDWAASERAGQNDIPKKLIYPLEHSYTQAGLGFSALKGADAAVATVVATAAAQAACDLYLALLTIEESGVAEYADYGSHRRGRWSDHDEDGLEAGEVIERHAFLSHWRRLDGGSAIAAELPILDEEISPPNALEDMEPDEEHFQEATGNAGASFERTYSRAALVLWPRERALTVLNQAGLRATLPFLGDLTDRWAVNSEGQASLLWRQAHELAGHMIATWPTRHGYRDEAPSPVASMLTLLARLGDTERIKALVAAMSASGSHSKGDNEALLATFDLFSPPQAAALVERVVAGAAAASLAACGDLLARAIAAPGGLQKSGAPRAELKPAAILLVQALPGGPSDLRPLWSRQAGVQPDFIVDLLTSVGCIDEARAAQAVQHILACPKVYDLDDVLVPAMRHLIKVAAVKDMAPVRRLCAACVAHLRARTGEPLEAPKDWRRASALACKCKDCTDLSRFLADPERKIWTFKAAEYARNHVKTSISTAKCDLDTMTETRGRPYGFVCTKNQASYDRRARQRHQDLVDLDVLEGASAVSLARSAEVESV